jgi:hypothetical protein
MLWKPRIIALHRSITSVCMSINRLVCLPQVLLSSNCIFGHDHTVLSKYITAAIIYSPVFIFDKQSYSDAMVTLSVCMLMKLWYEVMNHVFVFLSVRWVQHSGVLVVYSTWHWPLNMGWITVCAISLKGNPASSSYVTKNLVSLVIFLLCRDSLLSFPNIWLYWPVEVKVKLSLCLIIHHFQKICEGVEL